jgi:hypothetical protein
MLLPGGLSSAVSLPVSAEGCAFVEVPALLLVKGYSRYLGGVQPGCSKLVRGVDEAITAVSRSGGRYVFVSCRLRPGDFLLWVNH